MITNADIQAELERVMNKDQMDHHYSDLYVAKTPASTKIIQEYEYKNQVEIFRCNITNELWYDIPFAYTGNFEEDFK